MHYYYLVPGCDPSKAQWDQLSQAFLSKNHIVFFDSAYQGFARYPHVLSLFFCKNIDHWF